MFEYLRNVTTTDDLRKDARSYIDRGMITKEEILSDVERRFSEGFAPYDILHDFYSAKRYTYIMLELIDQENTEGAWKL